MSPPTIGQKVRIADDVARFGGREGTIVGFAGLICQGAVYVEIPDSGFKLDLAAFGGGLPGLPFDPHEFTIVEAP